MFLFAACEGAPPSAAEPLGAARGALPSPAPAAECGGKGLPDCPLQQWMKSTLQSYQREGNYDRLASALDQLQERAPAGYAHWADTASSAAAAARKHDEAGVRQACKSCHDEHRARYRRELRAAPWM